MTPTVPDTELIRVSEQIRTMAADFRDRGVQPDVDKLDELGREVRKLAVLARPAAGRDLTVFDFMDAVQLGSGEAAAEHLNRIARPSGGVGQSDAAEEEDAQMLRSVDTDPLRSALLDAVGGFTFRGSPVGDARRLADVVLGVVLTEDWRPVRGRQVPADPSPRSWSLPDPPPDDVTDVEDGPTAVELLDALEGMGAALVEIGIAVGLPRPSGIARWGAPEILARLATLNSGLKVPPRAAARIEQARADQAEGYGSTTSTVGGLLRELDRRAAELLRLRAALARPAVARTDVQPPADPQSHSRDVVEVPRGRLTEWYGLLRKAVDATVSPLAGDLSAASGEVAYWGQQPAAPAGDTAAAPAPWMVESRDERVDRLTRHVENVADCAGIEIEVREAGPLTGPAPLRRLVRALEGAGMLHDDPADDTAAPEDRITAVRELLNAICDPMDRAEAETHLDILGVTRAEVDEAKRRTAARPVRDTPTSGEEPTT